MPRSRAREEAWRLSVPDCGRAIPVHFDFCIQHKHQSEREALNQQHERLAAKEAGISHKLQELQRSEEEVKRRISLHKASTHADLVLKREAIQSANSELHKIRGKQQEFARELAIIEKDHTVVLRQLEQQALQNTEAIRETRLKTTAIVICGLFILFAVGCVLVFLMTRNAIALPRKQN